MKRRMVVIVLCLVYLALVSCGGSGSNQISGTWLHDKNTSSEVLSWFFEGKKVLVTHWREGYGEAYLAGGTYSIKDDKITFKWVYCGPTMNYYYGFGYDFTETFDLSQTEDTLVFSGIGSSHTLVFFTPTVRMIDLPEGLKGLGENRTR